MSQKIQDGEMYKQIGKIKSVQIGVEDHGIMVMNIDFDFGGSGQVYQVVLDTYDKEKDSRIGTVFGCELLRRICNLFTVDDINDMVGQTAYALYDSDEYGGFISGIENPPFNMHNHNMSNRIITKELFEELK